MAATTPDRYQMQGTAEADTLQLGSLLAFDWVPEAGDSGLAWNEAGHAIWGFEPAAVGHVVFDGVSAAVPFDSRASVLHFAFTYGPDFELDNTTAGKLWHWDPMTGVLDPLQFNGTIAFGDASDGSSYHYLLGATGVRFDGHQSYNTVGSSEGGTWQPAVGPVAAEVTAGVGDDTVLGAGGNDVLRGEAGADWLEGGDGYDRLLGGDDADHLDGGGGADTIDGQRGDDLILAKDGNDVASGGSGNDTLRSGEGADTLFGHQGDDLLEGGAGADWLIGGADRVQGWGFDTASYARSLAPVAVDLAAGTARGGEAEGDHLVFIRGLQGSGFGDVLTGDAAANRLQGDGGGDTLDGAAGDDTLTGGRGDNLLFGGKGNDVMDADDGNDRAWGGDGNDTINVSGGDNRVDAGAGSDLVNTGDGNDVIVAGAGDDLVYANGGNNKFQLGGISGAVLDGNDTFYAGSGTDKYVLYLNAEDGSAAGWGNDTIMGFHLAEGDQLIAFNSTAGAWDNSEFLKSLTSGASPFVTGTRSADGGDLKLDFHARDATASVLLKWFFWDNAAALTTGEKTTTFGGSVGSDDLATILLKSVQDGGVSGPDFIAKMHDYVARDFLFA